MAHTVSEVAKSLLMDAATLNKLLAERGYQVLSKERGGGWLATEEGKPYLTTMKGPRGEWLALTKEGVDLLRAEFAPATRKQVEELKQLIIKLYREPRNV